jgi:hypothetical protein
MHASLRRCATACITRRDSRYSGTVAVSGAGKTVGSNCVVRRPDDRVNRRLFRRWEGIKEPSLLNMIHLHPLEVASLDELEIIRAFYPKLLEVIRKLH